MWVYHKLLTLNIEHRKSCFNFKLPESIARLGNILPECECLLAKIDPNSSYVTFDTSIVNCHGSPI